MANPKDLVSTSPVITASAPMDSAAVAHEADQFVERLLAAHPEGAAVSNDTSPAAEGGAVNVFGVELQRQSAKQSEMLRQPLKEMARHGDEGGQVANALINLKMKVEEINPGKLNLDPGWATRLMGKIPGVGTPMKRYFSKYESAQTVIQSVLRSLEEGRDQLKRDNVTLEEDQKEMRSTAQKLERAVGLGQAIDAKLVAKSSALPAGDAQRKFIDEELIFPLRQRILDLQQQLAVQQQGTLAMELIIRNNRELVRGVDRSLSVTMSALSVGATIAVALANQKATLDTMDAVNRSTSDLIASTAARLKTQGVEIQNRASSATLDIESLKAAFQDINTAIADISKYRAEALPKMAQSILEMDRISQEAEQSIGRLEEGNRRQPQLLSSGAATLSSGQASPKKP